MESDGDSSSSKKRFCSEIKLNGNIVTGIRGGESDVLDIVVPSGVTVISSSAFTFCSMMTSLTLPDTLVTIGSSSFIFCIGITSLKLPSSLTAIGNGALA